MTPASPIPGLQAFLDALDTALGKSVGRTLTSASHASDVYEAYLFAIVLHAAMDCGLIVRLEDTAGRATTTLRLRTAPSHIDSGNFTHAILARPDGTEELEVHTGVYVQGTSGAEHECDVVVLQRSERRQRQRQSRRSPRSSSVVWAMEAKFYVQNNVGIAKAREYFGLNLELSGNSGRRTALVVTRSGDSVEKVFARHTPAGHFYRGVYPGQLSADNLRAHVRQILTRYLA